MAGKDSTQKVLAEFNSLKESMAQDIQTLTKQINDMDKKVVALAVTQKESMEKLNELLAKATSGGSKGGSKKAATQTKIDLLDADGKMVNNTLWFQHMWYNQYPEIKKNYLTSEHEKAIDEHMKGENFAKLTGEKKEKERMQFFWKTFVVKGSEHRDEKVCKKIIDGYNKAKAEMESKAKEAKEEEAKPASPTKKAPAAAAPKGGKKPPAKKPEPEPEPEPEEEQPEEDQEEGGDAEGENGDDE